MFVVDNIVCRSMNAVLIYMNDFYFILSFTDLEKSITGVWINKQMFYPLSWPLLFQFHVEQIFNYNTWLHFSCKYIIIITFLCFEHCYASKVNISYKGMIRRKKAEFDPLLHSIHMRIEEILFKYCFVLLSIKQ